MLHNIRLFYARNQGSTLMIALVVIIIFGMFAYALNKMKVETTASLYNPIIYERATVAAISSLEKVSYYLHPIDKQETQSCPSTEQLDNLSYEDQLCTVKLECAQRNVSLEDQRITLKGFFVKATATCNLGTDQDDQTSFEVTKIITSQIRAGEDL